jgi:dolichol-phosphate mannosyltransferase
MWSWIGFRQVGVPYRRAERFAGQTKYPFRKMTRLAIDGIVGFSRVPLRLALKLGFLSSIVALAAGVYTLTGKLSGAYTVAGWTSVVIAVLFLGGVQLAVIGFMGEYIGRIYEESIRRPLYIVAGLHGVVTGVGTPARAVISEPRTVANVVGEQQMIDLRVSP